MTSETAVERGYLAVLRHATARRLWTASTISMVGDYAAQGALLILAWDRAGGRIIGPAAVFAVQAIPAVIAGAIGGAWADRFPRSATLATLYLLTAITLLLPLAGVGVTSVLVAAGLLAALRTLIGAIGVGAVADAVPVHLRPGLVSLGNLSAQSSMVLGYLTGATLAVTLGPAIALGIDSAALVVSALLVATLHLPRPSGLKERVDLTEGVRVIWRHPTLRLLAILFAVSVTVTALPETLAVGAVGDGSPWLPLVLASSAAGSAVTIALLGRTALIERTKFQVGHLTVLAVAFTVTAAAIGAHPLWLVLGNATIGAGIAWTVGAQVTFVQHVPPARMAQVTGVMVALITAAEGAGAMAIGALAEFAGLGAAYVVGGAMTAIGAAIGLIALRRRPEVAVTEAIPADSPASA
jgi:MFS family permease